jgi:hypothetical protein
MTAVNDEGPWNPAARLPETGTWIESSEVFAGKKFPQKAKFQTSKKIDRPRDREWDQARAFRAKQTGGQQDEKRDPNPSRRQQEGSPKSQDKICAKSLAIGSLVILSIPYCDAHHACSECE